MKTHTRSLILLGCLALASCGSSSLPTERANVNDGSAPHATPLASSPAPTPTVASLKVPERVASHAITENGGGWHKAVRRITYQTSADGTQQPAMFYKPDADEPRPLLVALHSWSSDYTQPASAIYAEWCIGNGWVFIHPNFRGRNVRPEATGSELVVQDVVSAVDYAKQNARVDENRIYAVGWSGGGHLALLRRGVRLKFGRASRHGHRALS